MFEIVMFYPNLQCIDVFMPNMHHMLEQNGALFLHHLMMFEMMQNSHFGDVKLLFVCPRYLLEMLIVHMGSCIICTEHRHRS